MDPPIRPHARRRAVAAQTSGSAAAEKYIAGLTPSPLPSNAKALHDRVEIRHPRSLETVSLGWEQGDDNLSQNTARLHIELAECVETKTVTTTTTTKRKYPPLCVKEPQAFGPLDPNEYPLAFKPAPSQFAKFSYEVDGQFRKDTEKEQQVHMSQSGRVESLEHHLCRKRYGNDYSRHNIQSTGIQRSDRISQKQPEPSLRRSGRGLATGRPRSPYSKSCKLRELPANVYRAQKDEAQEASNRQNPRRLGLGVLLSEHTTLPATPDLSELDTSQHDMAQPHRHRFAAFTPQSGLSQDDEQGFFDDVASPPNTVNPEQFPCAVATPPIADSDLEPFGEVNAAFVQGQRPNINTVAAQNASLPSPGLSPTCTSAEFPNDRFPEDNSAEEDASSPDTQDGDVSEAVSDHILRRTRTRALRSFEDAMESEHAQSPIPTIMGAQTMIESFDMIPNDLKNFLMYQFLRRCPKKTLRFIADVVNPALKCDFLEQLPIELSLHVLSFLDYKDLCRAAQVSRQWRNVIDANETGWKELFDRDGYVLPIGELERAINQGWGWQDPYGPEGFEHDLSVQQGPSHQDDDVTITGVVKVEVRKPRQMMKRKRAAIGGGSDRSKRRSSGHEFSSKAKELLAKYPHTARYHKSEGPLTVANAAAIAVPDPQLGLPSLRKLHLFKSLYRRHHLLSRSWTSGKVEPHHMAFPAHPAHVITCLQFDDDKILTGSDDTLIHVYGTKTGFLRKKLEGHEGGVWALQYEGNVLVSGSTDRSVRVWDIEKGLCTQVFHGHTSTVRCLQILMPTPTGHIEKGKPVMAPEKPLIITGSRDSQLRVWRLPEQGSKRYIQTGPPAIDSDCPYFVRVLMGHTHSVRAITAHQDTLVSGSYDNTVRVWKISTGETLHRLQGHSMKVYSVVLDHKRNRCISGSMDNFVKIWSLDTGACLYTLEGHTSLVGLLDLHDERLVSAAADSTLRIWDPENGVCKSTLSAHTGAITCFQHDGQKVISGSDRTLKMWNVKTGECIKDLLSDLSGVWQVKFDERRCVAAVQRDNLTYVEVLDFGAVRDGIPASQRGSRILLSGGDAEADRIVEEEQGGADA